MIEKEDIINIDEELFGYRRGCELYDFMIQERLFVKNMSDDLLKKSIDILKHEKKRRRREELKFDFAFLFGDYRNI